LLEHAPIVGEVVRDELREKLRTKIKLPKKSIDEIERPLREGTVVEKPRKHLGLKITDPDDEWVVASAVAGAADVLVTEDAAVLKIAARSPVKIILMG
jgi:predicted nucleic acid-binding protein